MITVEALQAAVPLTESYNRRGLAISPMPGTELAQLVDQTVVTVLDSGAESVRADDSIRHINYESTASFTNHDDESGAPNHHNAALDRIVQAGAALVRGQLQLARNVVSPIVTQLAEAVLADVDAVGAKDLLGIEISQFSYPMVVRTPSFRESLEMFRETPIEDVPLRTNLPDLSEEQLQEALSTGSGINDKMISVWASTIGTDFIYRTWHDIFQINAKEINESNSLSTLRRFLEDDDCGPDYALAVYLLSNKLIDNPPEGTEMSLDLFDSQMVEFRNQAGARLTRLNNELDNANERGTIIKKLNSAQIVTYPEVYDEWISSGGDNDILLGNSVSAPTNYTVSALNENADKLREAWNRQASLLASTSDSARFALIRDSLRKHFMAQVRELDDTTPNDDKSTWVKIFSEELVLIKSDECANVYNVALKLVCRSRFFRSNAEQILTSIEKHLRENPKLAPREAAAIASIELIADWLSCQLVVGSVV